MNKKIERLSQTLLTTKGKRKDKTLDESLWYLKNKGVIKLEDELINIANKESSLSFGDRQFAIFIGAGLGLLNKEERTNEDIHV